MRWFKKSEPVDEDWSVLFRQNLENEMALMSKRLNDEAAMDYEPITVDGIDEFQRLFGLDLDHWQRVYMNALLDRDGTLQTRRDYIDAVFDLTNLVEAVDVRGGDNVIMLDIRGVNGYTPSFLLTYVRERIEPRMPVGSTLFMGDLNVTKAVWG